MHDAGTRTYFGLTQERMASWLGVARASLALAERAHQALTAGATPALQQARLVLAQLGYVYDGHGGRTLAPAPLPPPPAEREPLVRRLDTCQHQAGRLRHELADLRRRAAPYEARLAALPALRAWTGPVRDAKHEENWLALFEREAEQALRFDCGAGPQRLLEARIAGLDYEAELLAKTLATLPPET